jgi:hypothetical protein
MLKAQIDVESCAVLLLPFFCKVVKGGGGTFESTDQKLSAEGLGV